jgi:hypothetical protein
MAVESHFGPPVVLQAYEATRQVEALLADHAQLPPPPPTEELSQPTAEQVQVADSLFVAEHQEELQQANLVIGLYAGVVIGHQLFTEAAEEINRNDKEDEPRPRGECPRPGRGWN